MKTSKPSHTPLFFCIQLRWDVVVHFVVVGWIYFCLVFLSRYVPFLQTLQYIYATSIKHTIMTFFWSEYIYLCIELIQISQVISCEMVMIRALDNWWSYFPLFSGNSKIFIYCFLMVESLFKLSYHNGTIYFYRHGSQQRKY